MPVKHHPDRAQWCLLASRHLTDDHRVAVVVRFFRRKPDHLHVALEPPDVPERLLRMLGEFAAGARTVVGVVHARDALLDGVLWRRVVAIDQQRDLRTCEASRKGETEEPDSRLR